MVIGLGLDLAKDLSSISFEKSWSHITPQKRPAARPRLPPNPKGTLREQAHEVMRFFHYSERTEAAYWQWIVRFLKFHRNRNSTPHPDPLLGRGGEGTVRGWRHPKEMGAAEVNALICTMSLRDEAQPDFSGTPER